MKLFPFFHTLTLDLSWCFCYLMLAPGGWGYWLVKQISADTGSLAPDLAHLACLLPGSPSCSLQTYILCLFSGQEASLPFLLPGCPNLLKIGTPQEFKILCLDVISPWIGDELEACPTEHVVLQPGAETTVAVPQP